MADQTAHDATTEIPQGADQHQGHVLAVLLASEDRAGSERIFAYRKAELTTLVRALIRKYN